MVLHFVSDVLDVIWGTAPEAILLIYASPLFVRAGAGRARRLAALALLTFGASVVREISMEAFLGRGSLPIWIFYPLQTVSVLVALTLLLLTRSPIAASGPLVGWALMLAVSPMAEFASYLARPRSGAMVMDPDEWLVGGVTFQLGSLALWHGAVAAALVIWARRRRGQGRAFPACSRCGYTLTGLTNLTACPECGASFASPSPRQGEGESTKGELGIGE